MSKPFLYSLAERVLDDHGGELDEILIVVPSTRAKRFIYNYIKTIQEGKTSWLPSTVSFNQLVQEVSSLEPMDQLDLTLELYKCHQKHNSEEKLEDFITWSSTALTDFNDIENYLLDGKQIYSDLRDFKEIEEWSFSEGELSSDQKKFIEFWDYLGRLKQDFDKSLKARNFGYTGLTIRRAIELLESKEVKLNWKKIYFVGLNAISNSERKFINLLQEKGLAEVISDVDEYYHENKIHEAGLFMRRQEDFFKMKHELTNGFKEKKDLNFIRANTTVGMAHLAAQKLDSSTDKTALILGDENLIQPLLNVLPPDVKQANITMGFPLVNGLVWSGVRKLIECKLQLSKSDKVFVKSLSEMVHDPFLNVLIKDKTAWKNTCSLLEQKSRIGISLKEFKTLFTEGSILKESIESESTLELVGSLQKLLELSYHRFENLTDFIREQIAISHQFISRLAKRLEMTKELQNFSVFGFFIDRLVRNEKVPFEGEPYGGIQIMGLLEARALDFEHIIFCGATDALMPAVKKDSSFIPFELKIHYGLPTNKEKEAVFAYSFYRLCQRAESVQFIYSETEDGLAANEKSRFLNQLEHEWPKHSGGEIKYQTAAAVLPKKASVETVVIPKTEQHVELVKQRLESGISASAINTFISCPADFYYRYLAGFREPEKKDDLIHPSVTGSLLHDTLEELYTEYVGKVLSENSIIKLQKKAYNELDNQIEKKGLTDFLSAGENRLEYLAMQQKLDGFLKWELREIKKLALQGKHITIESLEKKYSAQIPGLKVGETEVVLGGFVDRIDRIGGELRVVDYKSGLVTETDLKLSETIDLIESSKGKALQQLVYGLLVGQAHPEYLEKGFVCGNISLRAISSGFITLKKKEDKKYKDFIINPENWSEIIDALNQVFKYMLNSETSWSHEKESKYCDFCLQ